MYSEAFSRAQICRYSNVLDVPPRCFAASLGVASRVTMLVHRFNPMAGCLDDGTHSIDARFPLAAQEGKLEGLGWKSLTTHALVQRMIAHAECEFAWERRLPENRGKRYPRKEVDFLREESRHGRRQSCDAQKQEGRAMTDSMAVMRSTRTI